MEIVTAPVVPGPLCAVVTAPALGRTAGLSSGAEVLGRRPRWSLPPARPTHL